MRYVGRHRAPRPLLLRRPVVGGVAAAIVLVAPVLYATGNFSGAIQGGTPSKQIADGTKKPAPTGSGDTVVLTDGSAGPTAGPKRPLAPVGTGLETGNGVDVTIATGRPTTTKPGSKPTKTTKPPVKTTKPPIKTTTRPPVVTTTLPPVITTTVPPVITTTVEPPEETTDEPPPPLP